MAGAAQPNGRSESAQTGADDDYGDTGGHDDDVERWKIEDLTGFRVRRLRSRSI